MASVIPAELHGKALVILNMSFFSSDLVCTFVSPQTEKILTGNLEP